MMTRLLLHRRSSMSSIEEEDESELSDELVTQIERRTFSQSPQDKQPDSTCVLQWDSESDDQIIQSMNRTSQTVSQQWRRFYIDLLGENAPVGKSFVKQLCIDQIWKILRISDLLLFLSFLFIELSLDISINWQLDLFD